MFYNFQLTIPPNTGKDEQISVLCPLTYGMIEKLDILFPPGPCGFVGVAVDRFNTQILPTNPDSWFISDSETITSIESIAIHDRPFEIVFRGYNLDDTYTHTIYLRILIRMEEEMAAGVSAFTLSE